jgi:hypothetical protein
VISLKAGGVRTWRASDPSLGEDDHRNAAGRAPSIRVAVGMQGIAREGQHIPDVQVVAMTGDDDLDPAVEAGEILSGALSSLHFDTRKGCILQGDPRGTQPSIRTRFPAAVV